MSWKSEASHGHSPATIALWKQHIRPEYQKKFDDVPCPFEKETLVQYVEFKSIPNATTTSLDDKLLSEALKTIRNQSTSDRNVKVRAFFIPWAMRDEQLGITSVLFDELLRALNVPDVFADAVKERHYWVKPGNVFQVRKKSDNDAKSFHLIYRYSWGIESGRAYIFMSYDYEADCTSYICINCNPKIRVEWLEQLNRSGGGSMSPFSLHALITAHTQNGWIEDASLFRMGLVLEENGMVDYRNSEDKTETLHSLSCAAHLLLEDMTDLEDRISFLQEALQVFEENLSSQSSSFVIEDSEVERREDVAMKFRYLLSKCKTTKRWLANYKDRTKIRIDLAFHLSAQQDNRNNIKISKSMMTISIVTMLFLPGTFISAIFSMVFFNYQKDNNGQEEFQVSGHWWYYLVVTLPLTAVVFAIWSVWVKWQELSESLNSRIGKSTEEVDVEMVNFV